MILGYPTSGMVLGLKGQWSRLVLLLGFTAIRRGFELYECLLVIMAHNALRPVYQSVNLAHISRTKRRIKFTLGHV